MKIKSLVGETGLFLFRTEGSHFLMGRFREIERSYRMDVLFVGLGVRLSIVRVP